MQPWALVLSESKNEDSPHSAEGSSATDSGRGASDEGCDGRPTRYIPPPPPPASLPRPAYWTVHHHPHPQSHLQPPPPSSSVPESSSSHTLPSRSLLRSARKQTSAAAPALHQQYPPSSRGTVRFKGLNSTPEEDADEVEMTTSVPTTPATATLPTVKSSVSDGLPRNGLSRGARGSAPTPPVRQQPRVDHAITSTPSRIVLPQSLSATAAAAASAPTTSRSPCIFVTTSRSFDV